MGQMPPYKEHRQIFIDWCFREVSPQRGDLTILGFDWLSPKEQTLLAVMRFPKRRSEWINGRWTAKQLLLKAIPLLDGRPMAEISIENHIAGYPLVMIDGQPLSGCLSISHRGERVAAAYTAHEDILIGIDLEWIEERHPAFLQDYFTGDEIVWVNTGQPNEQAARTTLLWSAKEAALKALRLGLAVDTRMIEVRSAFENEMESWQSLNYTSDLPEEGTHLIGWWQQRGNYMITLAINLPKYEDFSFRLREIPLKE
ncbi:MAG: hypothetical protein KatS3mg047_0447 [Bellilinea sp.]|nr:MAG: hypothetical protein KatS3mg047_0447 [Bellilinea sp.]